MILGQIYFYLLAALALAGSLVTVGARNPIRGAMGLLLTVVSVAGLFLALHAEFLAFVQLIVYAGAIVVLFLFVIMLLGPSAQTDRDHRGQIARAVGAAFFGLTAAAAIFLLQRSTMGADFPHSPTDFGGIGAMGRLLFSEGLGPFELSSALLMVAIIGAVAVARGRTASDALEQSPPRPALDEGDAR
jgi:NADH-quinone oxidoreductase subunit J